MPLEQARHGVDRADAHLVGLAAGDREAAEDAHRLEPPFPRDAVAHDDADGGAVGELAGVAGGDHAALDRRFDFGHPFVGRVRTNALVLGRDHFLDGFAAFVLVHRLHLGGDRHDLVAELPLAPRLGGLRLALHAVAVLTLPTDVVPLCDRFRRDDHRPVELRLMTRQPVVFGVIAVPLVLHERDGFHAAGDEDVSFSRENPLRGESDRLQARRAEAIDGHPGHAWRTTGADSDLARDVAAGCALRVGAPHDHVVELARVDPGAPDRVFHDVAAHLGAVGHVERAAPTLAERRAGSRHDHRVSHEVLLAHSRDE